GFGTILGSVNFITTILCMRMPGMTMFRMPIFTWNALITAVLVLMAFPPLASALLALGADRRFDANIFDAANGGPVLWQHLFWFFGHPEVYVLALPLDRKSTRLNSSHVSISYAVFCLKKKIQYYIHLSK